MDDANIQQQIIDALKAVAPELDAATLKADAPLRNQVDLDSFDWLRFLVDLHERFDVEIPESDYRQLTTLNDIAAYLGAKLPV